VAGALDCGHRGNLYHYVHRGNLYTRGRSVETAAAGVVPNTAEGAKPESIDILSSKKPAVIRQALQKEQSLLRRLRKFCGGAAGASFLGAKAGPRIWAQFLGHNLGQSARVLTVGTLAPGPKSRAQNLGPIPGRHMSGCWKDGPWFYIVDFHLPLFSTSGLPYGLLDTVGVQALSAKPKQDTRHMGAFYPSRYRDGKARPTSRVPSRLPSSFTVTLDFIFKVATTLIDAARHTADHCAFERWPGRTLPGIMGPLREQDMA